MQPLARLYRLISARYIICRLVNDVLQIGERKKDVFRRLPVKRSHGKVIILVLSDSKLLFEVLKRIEFMTGIKLFIIFSVTAFDFAVVSGRKRTNFSVLNPQFGQSLFKERWQLILTVTHLIGKFKTVVRLDTLNGIRELLDHIL